MDKDMKDMNIAELDQKDLEKAAGGTFTLNYYWRSEYEDAGIKVVTHFIDKDEFWWKGENIGEKGANSVVFFSGPKGRGFESRHFDHVKARRRKASGLLFVFGFLLYCG